MVAINGLILAAGHSRRMGVENKLTKQWQGKPLLRHCVDAAMASALENILVVTGHEAQEVAAILPSNCMTVYNPHADQGMSTSLVTGILNLPKDVAVMILLGDMPIVTSPDINRLIDAFLGAGDAAKIVVATIEGQWGNPVIFGPGHRADLLQISGDRGARSLLQNNQKHLIEVEIGLAAGRDFDDTQAFERD